MTKHQKISLASSRDIPFIKLLLSQSNVRKIKAGVSIEDLAEDIARRGLLQGLSVRPIIAEDGTETGLYEIPAGGRRFRALELLAKQKRLARTAPVPCIVREGGIAEEDTRHLHHGRCAGSGASLSAIRWPQAAYIGGRCGRYPYFPAHQSHYAARRSNAA